MIFSLHYKEHPGLEHFRITKLSEVLGSVINKPDYRTIVFCDPLCIPAYDFSQMQYSGFRWKEYSCKWSADDVSKLKQVILDITSNKLDCHTPDSAEYWISHYAFKAKPGYGKAAVRKYINKILQGKV